MKFSIRLKEEGTSRTWTETYTMPQLKTASAVNTWVMNTLENEVNPNLMKGEGKRVVLEISILPQPKMEHDWEKTNLMTAMKGHQAYDTYRCKKCGATGKRFGLTPFIRPDKTQPEFCEVSL